MALFHSESSDPLHFGARIVEEERRLARTSLLATGTLACPRCDAPVAPVTTLRPADPIACPFCFHDAHVRDFLSLAAPSRPARVSVRVINRFARR